MAGLIGAAALAMATDRVLLVDWDGLDEVLAPNLVNWRYDEKRVISEETATWLAGVSSNSIYQQRVHRGKHAAPRNVGAMVSEFSRGTDPTLQVPARRPLPTYPPTHTHTYVHIRSSPTCRWPRMKTWRC